MTGATVDVFSHPWLGGLFGDDAVASVWSADAQLDHYRAFETALAQALADTGRVNTDMAEAAADIIQSTPLDQNTLARGTAQDGLPIPELIRQLRGDAGDAETAIHTGSTSQDVMDSALALTLQATNRLMLARLETLSVALDDLRAEHGANPLMGRTRMQAALPVTVADRIDAWHRPLIGHTRALTDLAPQTEQLQLGGAVGTRHGFGADGPAIAAHMAGALGLQDGPVWHNDRSAIADYASRLSLITGSLGKMGQDIALMAQQGIDEIAIRGGGSSSAMPHKANPILAELLVTLARFNATQVAGLHQALVHEQERSGAAWALEWMILPQMAMATGRALSASATLCSQITWIGAPKTTP